MKIENLNNNADKTNSWGGPRRGAGRPVGSKTKISIGSILDSIERKTGGITYDELLIEDFLKARMGEDTALVAKYHQLLLNKIVADKSEVEVINSTEAIEMKKQAFLDALNSLSTRGVS